MEGYGRTWARGPWTAPSILALLASCSRFDAAEGPGTVGPEAGAPIPTDGGTSGADATGSSAGSAYAAAVLADRPMAYWRFGEKAGTTIAKSETPGFDALYPPECKVDAPGLLSGDPDTSVTVGPKCRIKVQNLDVLRLKAFTLEAWARPRIIDGNNRKILDQDTYPSEGRHQVGLFFNANVGIRFEHFVNGIPHTTDRLAVAANTRYHLVAVFDGNTDTLYVDGFAGTPVPEKDVTTSTDTSDFFVGSNWLGNNDYDGVIDEVAVYDHALDAEAIARHLAAGR